jgi:Fuc2NAc and GlcNAc transferase
MNPVLAAALVAALVASWAGTAAVRRYAVARALLDVPNHRSSHSVATPRGGGLAIALVLLPAIAVMGVAGVLPARVAAALAGGGAAVAVVGWLDDARGLSARVRAAVHFAAAAWALGCLGGMPGLRLGTAELHLGVGGAVLAAVGIVWITNLYNFMDGIDGIAGTEAVTTGAAAGALLLAAGARPLAAVSLLLAAASAGFLLWNWHPARIFMGDVGSGLLGFLFAVLAVATENAGALPLFAWVMLMGVFVVDATLTLARRLARRERVHQAHRSHAYQRAVRAGFTHAQVTAGVGAVNLALAALTVAAVAWPALWVPAVLCGLALLAGLYLWIERRAPMR